MDTLPSSERGGFWRRLGEFVIDAAITAAGLQLLALAAYPLSGGRVQSNFLQVAAHCQHLNTVPAGLGIPAGSETYHAVECVNDLLFGLPTARWVTISQYPEPHVGGNRSETFQVDAAGHPLDYFWSNISTLVLIIYRIIFEWRSGQTIGKRLARVQVIETHPTASVVPSAVKRNLVLFLPVLVLPVFALVYAPLWLLPAVSVLAVIVWQIVSRRDTYYDKVAGTRVIRVPRKQPRLTVPTPAV
jgi:uncharacterized RDD family membrane protein YckC